MGRPAKDLPSELTTFPVDKTQVWIGVDNENTAVQGSQKISQQTLETFVNPRVLSGAISKWDTQFTDAVLADRVVVGQHIVAGAYTTSAEMRRVTAISGNDITVAQPFRRAHSVGDNVAINFDGNRDVRYWGATGDGSTSDSAAIQAAVDDFEIEVDSDAEVSSQTFTVDTGTDTLTTASGHELADRMPVHLTTSGSLPTGITTGRIYFILNATATTFQLAETPGGSAIDLTGSESGTHTWHRQMETRGNNVYFPHGKYLITAAVKVPAISPYFTGQFTMFGNNATLVTTSFTGPFFDTEDHPVNIVSNYNTNATSKWVFRDLNFRDDSTAWNAAGTAHVFNWKFYRMLITNCTFTRFLACIQSDDTTDWEDEYIQTTRIVNCRFDSCDDVVKVSKSWDFLFQGNQVDSCPNVVRCLALNSTAMVQGTIANNTIQGGGNGTPLHIRGGRGVTVINNYFEGQNTGGNPYIDMTLGQQPRGITISGNHIELHANLEDDADYFPIAINPIAEGVTLQGNQSSGGLVDPWSINNETENWVLIGNHVLYTEANANSSVEHWGHNLRKITKNAYFLTEDNTAVDVEFDGDGPLATASMGGQAGSFRVRVSARALFAPNRGASTENANYEKVAAFYHWSSSLVDIGLHQEGSTTDVAADIESADATSQGWGLTIETDTDGDRFTASVSSATLTSNGHGLSNGDEIYFSDAPTPLVDWRPYYVVNATTNTFEVARGPGLSAITMTNGGSFNGWHKDHLNVRVQGSTLGDTQWHIEAEILIGLFPEPAEESGSSDSTSSKTGSSSSQTNSTSSSSSSST